MFAFKIFAFKQPFTFFLTFHLLQLLITDKTTFIHILLICAISPYVMEESNFEKKNSYG